jgi:hypothetical protein
MGRDYTEGKGRVLPFDCPNVKMEPYFCSFLLFRLQRFDTLSIIQQRCDVTGDTPCSQEF